MEELGVEKGNVALKLFYLSLKGNFTTQCNIGGGLDIAVDKNIDWNPKNPNKEPYHKRVLVVRFI